MKNRQRSSMAVVRLVALVALCGLSAVPRHQTHAFDSDKLYKYEFEGAITSKVTGNNRPQYSGVALRTPIQVRKSKPDELTVRLESPQSGTFNELIEDFHLYKHNYKPIGEQASGLDSAFRIYLDNETGAVKSFDSHKDEPKWVTNFKRGLLSFFQLKLKAPGSGGSGEQQQQDASSASSPASKNIGSNQYYSTLEKSVFGECETDYLVMAESLAGAAESEQQQFAMNVTKTRNMARCKSRFLHRFFPIDSNECFENEKDLRLYKHSNAIFQYNLVGTRQNYVIQQVLVDEVSSFAPFGQSAHGHQINSKFIMKLVHTEPISSGAELQADDSSLIKLESLSYDPPEMLNFYANINLDQEHHLSSIYQSSATVEQVMQAFDSLVAEHRGYTGAFEQLGGVSGKEAPKMQENSRIAEHFIQLNELVGTLNTHKIEQLYALVDERGEAHKKIFWDLMSVTGTNPSFNFMKRLITDGDAPSVKIKDFLTRLSYHIKMPSKSLFDEYVYLCKSDKIQTNQQYKRLCSLPLASLIHQHCAKPHGKFLRMQQEGAANATAYKRGQNTCQMATAEEYFARLVTPMPQVSSASAGSAEEFSIGDKMFNIKMAGELGVRASIDYLIEVIANRDEHPSLRSAAMWQLYKAARIYPNQVKRLVVPYYYDRGELLEVRLAAFYNWFAAGMSLHEMETMAKQLSSEPSRQLVIYVHSLIASLANMEPGIPCSHSNDRQARLVLATVKRALARHSAPSLTDSQATLSSSWLPEFGYGTTSLMSVIFSNDSMAPTNVFYSSNEIMSGLKLTPMSFSMQAYGLDKLIKRVVGINGMLADKDSFMDVFSLKRRSRRQVSAELIKQEAQEIDQELKLAVREFDDVYVAITISAYGRPISFFDRDSRELKKMLSEDGTIRVPAIKKLLHSFNNHTTQQMLVNFEKLEVFNNELGLPLYQSISDFDYKTIKLNSIKLDVEPGFFRDERQGKPPTRFAVALDAKMSRHNEMFVSSGSIVASQKQLVGVGFHKKKLANLPIKLAIEANITHSQVSIKHQPIHDSLLYIKQTPVAFIKSYDPARLSTVGGASSDNQWRPLYAMNDSKQMKPFKLEYVTPLALGFRLEGKHRVGQDWSMAAWRRHIGSIGLAAAKFIYFYSPNGQPLEARLSTISTEENPTRELVELFSWRHHHRDSSTTAADLNEVERELEQATSSQGTSEGQPTTVSYKLALIGGSAAKERRIGLELSYSRSFDRLLHKWRAFYSRTPLESQPSSSAQYSEASTNLCWLGQMQFPRIPVDKLLNFELSQLDQSANLSSELTFGDECQESKLSQASGVARVSARVAFGWTPEQRRAIMRALGNESQQAQVEDEDEEQADYSSGVYKRLHTECLLGRGAEQSSGSKLEPACLELLRKISELASISAQFDYKDVPERWTKLVRRLGGLYTYARAGYIEEMDDKPPGSPDYYKSNDGSRDRAHLKAKISSSPVEQANNWRQLSYEFDTPNYHVMYKNVPIGLRPLSTFPLFGSSFYQQVQRRAGTVSCLISSTTVSTFDNYTYKLPPVGEGCFKLIAKDCSPEANYIVLGAKVGQTGKVVKVYLAQRFKVEFVPDKNGTIISDIKVNGETVQIEQGKPALRRDTKLGQRTMEAFTIDYNGAYYTLNSKLYKFSVATDGTWIHVQQSKYYSGKSCGLCGDSNGDHLFEFTSPRRRVCKNSADFVWSYVLPSTCARKPANIECA